MLAFSTHDLHGVYTSLVLKRLCSLLPTVAAVPVISRNAEHYSLLLEYLLKCSGINTLGSRQGTQVLTLWAAGRELHFMQNRSTIKHLWQLVVINDE